jgi:hypothetical protein
MSCRFGLSGKTRMTLVRSLLISLPNSLLIKIAIWDNRSVFHTATFDYDDQGDRFGNRAVGLGEVPYFDPQSTSRRVALEKS